MAYPNKFINNPITGQSYLFLQTAVSSNGNLLEMESGFQANSKEPPEHYHPFQEEDFTVLEGVLTVKINGSTLQLQKGDTLHIPMNTVHAMWNSSGAKTVVNWKVMPAINSEKLFETFAGLAIDNKTDKNGMPLFLQSVLIAQKFSKEFRLARPGYALQKIVFGILAPMAKALGYESNFEKYID